MTTCRLALGVMYVFSEEEKKDYKILLLEV
jgi:hypothetical protein